jgi:predicted TIM-barrel fold metal-dependent hydrolase
MDKQKYAKTYQLVSADDHVQEPEDTWQKRVPSKLKARAPKIVHTPNGDAWEIDGRVGATFGLGAQAGRKFEESKPAGETYASIRTGSYEPNERLKDMDIDGVDAQVLFPNLAIAEFYNMKDLELQLACLRAYNDFMSDFCSVDPARLLGVALLPTDDVDAAVAEIGRVAKMREIRGVMVPTYPRLKPLDNPIYDPIWAAAQDADLPVHIHLITGSKAERFNELNSAGLLCAEMANHSLACYETLAKVIFTGVLERFPRLRFVSVEGNIGWIGYFLEKMDRTYQRHRHWTKLDLPRLPSEYFHRQVYATFIEDPVGVKIAELIGADNLMWSSDYPHTDTTWPNSRQYVEETFKGVSEETKRKIVAGNAVRLYGLS